MKHIYINDRLHPLTIAVTGRIPRQWIFTQGQPYLLLTPPRLERLAALLPLADSRFSRLLHLIRRHSPEPEEFCHPLGLMATSQLRSEEYPPVSCSSCGELHSPHPEEAGLPCPGCLERRRLAERHAPGAAAIRDRLLDRQARLRLREKDPSAFRDGTLSPNWRINHARRLQRDWEAAVNRILMGRAYREVAKEFDCSVGTLHNRVMESKWWEKN